MARFPQKTGQRGSLKWIQQIINRHPVLIDKELRQALRLPGGENIEWVSPLEADDYAEYRDQAFVDKLGIIPSNQPLNDYWPRWGPQWDALARTNGGKIILLEAKAHIRELGSAGCKATSPVSRKKIEKALTDARRYFKMDAGTDWMTRFYQYTNRLAHLYFLREVNVIDAHLVFVYFLNDSEQNGPATPQEWEAGLLVLHEALGLRGRIPTNIVHDVFIDVQSL